MPNLIPLADEIEIWTIAVGAMTQSIVRTHVSAMQTRTWPELCAHAWADLWLGVIPRG